VSVRADAAAVEDCDAGTTYDIVVIKGIVADKTDMLATSLAGARCGLPGRDRAPEDCVKVQRLALAVHVTDEMHTSPLVEAVDDSRVEKSILRPVHTDVRVVF
jgi:hypothetical protein